jgi:hypothetical protein
MLKKMTAGAAATLLFFASSSVFAEDDGDEPKVALLKLPAVLISAQLWL